MNSINDTVLPQVTPLCSDVTTRCAAVLSGRAVLWCNRTLHTWTGHRGTEPEVTSDSKLCPLLIGYCFNLQLGPIISTQLYSSRTFQTGVKPVNKESDMTNRIKTMMNAGHIRRREAGCFRLFLKHTVLLLLFTCSIACHIVNLPTWGNSSVVTLWTPLLGDRQ